MAKFKPLDLGKDISNSTSFLNQLVDVIQEDVSGSATRKKYQVFVTGGVGPGVTSSLYQTVFDQDFTLQTANPVFDITFGIYSGSYTVASASTGQDANGKLLFPSTSLMMREKINVYKQYAQLLLGNANSAFFAPLNSGDSSDRIDEALFISYKRLFARDNIRRETSAFQLYQTGVMAGGYPPTGEASANIGANINLTSTGSYAILTDIGAASHKQVNVAGNYGAIVNSANTANRVGVVWYEHGTYVFDMQKVFSGTQQMSGVIDAMASAYGGDSTVPAGKTVIGAADSANPSAKFIPDFIVSASMDNVIDHVASTRFQSGTLSAMTFQNQTRISSTLVFCRVNWDEFNYSSNPTYTDSQNNIVVIETGAGASSIQRAFSFITTVGLYDSNENLLAVAKLSRPLEKNDQKDITLRVRMDF